MIWNGWQRLIAAATCASLVGTVACSGRNDRAADTAATASSSGDVARSDSAARAAAPGATTPATPAGSTATSASAMSITGGDAEILQVLAVVDQGEIQDGRLAQQQARNAQVKSFARELVTDHTKSLQKDRQLAKSANVDLSSVIKSGAPAGKAKGDTTAATPSAASGAPSAVVSQLETRHSQRMDSVKAQKGAAFDQAFVDAQVMAHQEVLDLLQRAQTQAQDTALQKHVTEAITAMQGHVSRGQKVLQTLVAGGSTPSASDSAPKAKSAADTGRRP